MAKSQRMVVMDKLSSSVYVRKPRLHLVLPIPFCLAQYSGPLHTRTKSREHEIVRAQNKVSEGRPKAPPKSCSAVTDPRV